MDSYEDMQVTLIWTDPEATTQTTFPFPVSKDVQAASRRIFREPSICINGSDVGVECFETPRIVAIGPEHPFKPRRMPVMSAQEKRSSYITGQYSANTPSSGKGDILLPPPSKYADVNHECIRLRILIGRLVPGFAVYKRNVDWALYVDATDASIGLMPDPSLKDVYERQHLLRQWRFPGFTHDVFGVSLKFDCNVITSNNATCSTQCFNLGQVRIERCNDEASSNDRYKDEILIDWEDMYFTEEAEWQCLYYKFRCLYAKNVTDRDGFLESATLREILPQYVQRLQFRYRWRSGSEWKTFYVKIPPYLDELKELTDCERRVLSTDRDLDLDIKLLVQLDKVRLRSKERRFIGESFVSTIDDPSYAVVGVTNPPTFLSTAAWSTFLQAKKSSRSQTATDYVDPSCFHEPTILCVSWRKEDASNDDPLRLFVSMCGRLSYKEKPTGYMLLKICGQNEFFALGTGSERPWESVEDDYDKISGEQRYRAADGEWYYREDDWWSGEETSSVSGRSSSYDYCDIPPTMVVRSRLYHLPSFPDCVQFQLQHVGELRLQYLSTVVEMRENSSQERVLADQAMSV